MLAEGADVCIYEMPLGHGSLLAVHLAHQLRYECHISEQIECDVIYYHVIVPVDS